MDVLHEEAQWWRQALASGAGEPSPASLAEHEQRLPAQALFRVVIPAILDSFSSVTISYRHEHQAWLAGVVRTLFSRLDASPSEQVEVPPGFWTFLLHHGWSDVIGQALASSWIAPPDAEAGAVMVRHAIETQETASLRVMLEHGFSPNALAAHMLPPLALVRTVEQAQVLFDHGADVSHRATRQRVYSNWCSRIPLNSMGPFNALWDAHVPPLSPAERLEDLRDTMSLDVKGRLVHQLARGALRGKERTEHGESLLDLAACTLARRVDQIICVPRMSSLGPPRPLLDEVVPVKTEALEVLWRRCPPQTDPAGAQRMAVALLAFSGPRVTHWLPRLQLPCPLPQGLRENLVRGLPWEEPTQAFALANLAAHDLFDDRGRWRAWTEAGAHADVPQRLRELARGESPRSHRALDLLGRQHDWCTRLPGDPWEPVLALWAGWVDQLPHAASRQGRTRWGMPGNRQQPGSAIQDVVIHLLDNQVTPSLAALDRYLGTLVRLADDKPEWIPQEVLTHLEQIALQHAVPQPSHPSGPRIRL